MKEEDGAVIRASNYTNEYRDNPNAGTDHVFVTLKDTSIGQAQQSFKIYLHATIETTRKALGNWCFFVACMCTSLRDQLKWITLSS